MHALLTQSYMHTVCRRLHRLFDNIIYLTIFHSAEKFPLFHVLSAGRINEYFFRKNIVLLRGKICCKTSLSFAISVILSHQLSLSLFQNCTPSWCFRAFSNLRRSDTPSFSFFIWIKTGYSFGHFSWHCVFPCGCLFWAPMSTFYEWQRNWLKKSTLFRLVATKANW